MPGRGALGEQGDVSHLLYSHGTWQPQASAGLGRGFSSSSLLAGDHSVTASHQPWSLDSCPLAELRGVFLGPRGGRNVMEDPILQFLFPGKEGHPH